jgi:hypothetical protein
MKCEWTIHTSLLILVRPVRELIAKAEVKMQKAKVKIDFCILPFDSIYVFPSWS